MSAEPPHPPDDPERPKTPEEQAAAPAVGEAPPAASAEDDAAASEAVEAQAESGTPQAEAEPPPPEPAPETIEPVIVPPAPAAPAAEPPRPEAEPPPSEPAAETIEPVVAPPAPAAPAAEPPPTPPLPPPPPQPPASEAEAAKPRRAWRLLAALAALLVVAAIAATGIYFANRPQAPVLGNAEAPAAPEAEQDPWAGLAEYDRLIVRPLSMPRPVYGIAMQEASLSGYADVEFTVGADGRASDIVVVRESVEDIGYAEEARRLVAAARWPTEWRGRAAPYAGRFRVIFPPGRSSSRAIAPVSIASPNITPDIRALGRDVSVTLLVRVRADGGVEDVRLLEADVDSPAAAAEAMRVARGARFPAAAAGYETRLMVRFDVVGGGAGEQRPSGPAVSLSEVPFSQRPSASDFSRHYPRRALAAGVDGRVALDCVVGGDLRLACRVAEEDPPGQGFGTAALRIARRFRAERQFPDGRSTIGASVRVPMAFRVE